MLLGYQLPDTNGLRVLEALQKTTSAEAVILLTAYSIVTEAVQLTARLR